MGLLVPNAWLLKGNFCVSYKLYWVPGADMFGLFIRAAGFLLIIDYFTITYGNYTYFALTPILVKLSFWNSTLSLYNFIFWCISDFL